MRIVPFSAIALGSIGLLLSDSIAPEVRASEVQSVRSAFSGYQQAILADRGAEAVKYVSANTIDYYQKVRELALYSNKAELQKLPTVDMMMVMLMRHRVPTQELQQMSGEGLVTYAIDRGWIGKRSVPNLKIKSVKVTSNQAIATFDVKAKGDSPKMVFLKEKNRWKLDLTSILKQTESAFNALIQQQKMTREKFIFSLLSIVAENPIDEKTAWNPPLQR